MHVYKCTIIEIRIEKMRKKNKKEKKKYKNRKERQYKNTGKHHAQKDWNPHDKMKKVTTRSIWL
jgi:hypothetical protein